MQTFSEKFKSSPFYRPSILLISLISAIVLIRALTPSDLAIFDQDITVSYMQDLIQNKNFFYQRLATGRITISTKPPMYVWLASPFVWLFGYHSDWATKIPAIFAFTALCVLLMIWTAKIISPEACWLAPAFLICSSHGIKYIYTSRPDGLLAFFMIASIYCFYRFEFDADEKHKSYWRITAWFLMGLGFLTKGPVALAVPFSAWLAYLLLERRPKDIIKFFSLTGIAIFLLLALSWFIPAYLKGGEEFKKVVIVEEIIERVTGHGSPESKAASKVKPFWYFIPHFFARSAPWSIIGLLAIIIYYFKKNIFLERKIFNFIFGWLLGGFIFFSAVKGKRLDYVYPLEPAIEIIAAAWIASMWRSYPKNLLAKILSPVVIIIIFLIIISGTIVNEAFLCYSAKNPIADNLKKFSNQINQTIGEEKFVVSKSVPNLLIYYIGGRNRISSSENVRWAIVVKEDMKVVDPEHLGEIKTIYEGLIIPNWKSKIYLIELSAEGKKYLNNQTIFAPPQRP